MKRGYIRSVSLILCLVVVLSCAAFGTVGFAESAGSLPENTVIVIAENCPETDASAAEVIRQGVRLSTGRELSIVSDSEPCADYEIAVGNTKRYSVDVDGLDDGSYRIRAYEGGVSVAGAGNRGTIYGAYAFIKECGDVHCYTSTIGLKAYGNDFVIPSDLSIDYNTYFEYTETDWYSPRELQYSVANGLNGDKYRAIPSGMGGMVEFVSNPWHTLARQFCSFSKYHKEHPEYFAIHNGTRPSETSKAQLCLTNPDVLKIVTEEVISLLSKKHDPSSSLQIVSLTQNDNQNYCECENCKALDDANGSHAGSIVTFANKVAEAVAAAGYDNVAIETFAYQYSRQAPTNVKPNPNVIIFFCTLEGCFVHSIGDDSCEYNTDLKNDLTAWGKICDRIHVWDYTNNFSYTLGIFPNFGVLQENLQFFYENNVKGVYEEGNYYMKDVDTEFGELKAYLLSRLMQDPYCDYYAEMDNFCKAYYGDGWKAVRDFIQMTIDKPLKEGNKLTIRTPMNVTLDFSLLDVIKADRLWAEAKRLTSGDETANEHVRRSELSWRYWKCCNRKGEFSLFVTREARSEELYNDLVAFGVTKFSEGVKLAEPVDFAVLDGAYWYEGSEPSNIFETWAIKVRAFFNSLKLGEFC